MERTVLLSVIIPVYKVEEYLKQCVDSVLKHTTDVMEIILVDDGSPDRCPMICDEYQKLYSSRIQVVHKKNGGLSDARNAGLQYAHGEYIAFLDSDDYWSEEIFFDEMLHKLRTRKFDVVVYGCCDLFVKTGVQKPSRIGYDAAFMETHTRTEVIEYLRKCNLFPGAAWLICVKNKLLQDNHILFKTGITAEDYDWLLEVFTHAETFSAYDQLLYIYRYGRNGAITSDISLSRIDGLLYTTDKWLKRMNQEEDKRLKKTILGYVAYIYGTSFQVVSRMNHTDRKAAVSRLREYRTVLEYADKRKSKALRIATKIVGIQNTIELLRILRR